MSEHVKRENANRAGKKGPTNNHSGKGKALPDTLPMDLIRQIGETDVTHELFANDANIVRLGIERGTRAVEHAIRGKVAVARGNERVGHLQTKRSKRRRKEVKGKKNYV